MNYWAIITPHTSSGESPSLWVRMHVYPHHCHSQSMAEHCSGNYKLQVHITQKSVVKLRSVIMIRKQQTVSLRKVV